MRQSEKSELMSRIQKISEPALKAKDALLNADGGGAIFQIGIAYAFLNRLFEDVKETEVDPDEDDYPEGTASVLFTDTAWRKSAQEPSEYEAAAIAAEQRVKDEADVVLPAPSGEQAATGTGAHVKVSNLPEASLIPPKKKADPDEELPKPKRRAGRPKKFTLDEDSPDPLE